MTTSLSPLPFVDDPSIRFRLWTGLEEVPGMAAANNRLRAHTGVLEPIDVEGMRHRYTHLVNSDPLEDCVVATMHGTTVGYGRVEWHDLVDGDRIYDHTVLVAPDAWGLGIARALNDWLAAHALVCWREHPAPWELEAQLMRTLSLPLNIQGNDHHVFYPTLRRVRAEALAQARQLPVYN